MKNIIQFKITKGDSQYVAESIDLPIVTQGKTLDEVAINIQEAVELHLQDEDIAQYEFVKQPAVMVNFEIDRPYGQA
ncbi:type II toxin-antitoxin system HicB family antitoxin [Candidatus Uhrbacteria bacterium]|nr:type II toxin-antitoxin system HicB family antitoxin [Candidatus Uhrbacteria bacterium]